MKFASILALVLALAAPAMAYKPASEIIVPPPQYNNQMGAKYTGSFKRIMTTLSEVRRICGMPNALACAKRSGWPGEGYPARSCTVVMPNDMPADLRLAVNTHEVAHCMGWVHAKPEPNG